MTKVTNAKVKPQIYYGLHMAEGVAQYREPDRAPYTVFIGEEAIKNMDPTFAGCPVYVRHVDEVNLENLQLEADGYVTESFFNKADGKHWVKFVIVSDKGHEAIRNGWKLSNCYQPTRFRNGGLWHGVEYHREITEGEYEHLALVQNPRYEESVILTPEEFKRYNGEKELHLSKLANSKEKGEHMFFKRTKVENTADYESLSVVLPKSKKEITISELVTEMDKVFNMHGYANDEHMVKVGEEEMSVKNLVKKHMAACNELSDMKKPKEEDEKKNESEEELEESKNLEKKKKNESEEVPAPAPSEEERKAEEKKVADAAIKAKEEEVSAEEKKANALHFDALKNAPNTPIKEEPSVEMSEDRVARGRERYGR